MASEYSSKPSYLEPSPLGTKEYWDNLYAKEMQNYTQDPMDQGTIWFDDSSAEDKVVAFLEKQIVECKILGDVGKNECSFLDLGTGNGHLLFTLRECERQGEEEVEGEKESWGGRMLGVDYSSQSIEFAKQIGAEKKRTKGKKNEIEFKQWDIMKHDANVVLDGANAQGWHVVLDKGTFDAISLSEQRDAHDRRVCETYQERVAPLLRPGGIFLLTSCNWTQDELVAWFGGEFDFVDSIHYKSFSFGGKTGQTISSVCFRKGLLR